MLQADLRWLLREGRTTLGGTSPRSPLGPDAASAVPAAAGHGTVGLIIKLHTVPFTSTSLLGGRTVAGGGGLGGGGLGDGSSRPLLALLPAVAGHGASGTNNGGAQAKCLSASGGGLGGQQAGLVTNDSTVVSSGEQQQGTAGLSGQEEGEGGVLGPLISSRMR